MVGLGETGHFGLEVFEEEGEDWVVGCGGEGPLGELDGICVAHSPVFVGVGVVVAFDS